MNPWLVELERIDWTAYECLCGVSGHVGRDLQQIILAQSVAEMRGASLDGHVEDNSVVADVAAPAVGVIMAALQENLASNVRNKLMVTLVRVVVGEASEDVSAAIHEHVRDGLWTIYGEATRGATEIAIDILECVEHDQARLEYFRNALQPRLEKRRKQ
ncbi:hypothetical protein [Streptomyces sp. NPDC048623]|uniref:hypothetical protein n=1 Tax=Streptomyces sp. NPDC048623 TaxID=3155761 RepID=UPI00342FAFD0